MKNITDYMTDKDIERLKNIAVDSMLDDRCLGFDETVFEFLKSIDSATFAEILYNSYPNIHGLILKDEALSFRYEYKLSDDICFRYICSKFNYNIHSNYKNIYGDYTVVLEKIFPKRINGHDFSRLFHVCSKKRIDDILSSGIHPKFCRKELEQHLKLKQDKYNYNILPRTYLIGFMEDNDNLKYIIENVASQIGIDDFCVIEVSLRNLTVYKDPVMDDEYSYYTFDFVHRKFLSEFDFSK